MRRAVRNAAVKTLSAPPQQIEALLRNKERWFLYSLLEHTNRPPEPDDVAACATQWVSETEGWHDCVDALFTAAKESPRIVLVQIVDMVYRHSSQQPTTEYLKATGEVLFGHERLMNLLRSIPQASYPDDQFCAQLRKIAEAATSVA